MKIKIIATGISGLVGSRIVELLGNEYEFISFSLDKSIDITDFNLLKKKFSEFPEIKIVLHLAAFTDVSKAWEQNEDKNGSCYRVNVLGSKNIAQLCKRNNKYLIHVSTDFVFDGEKPRQQSYTEKDVPNPIEWYGKTKFWAEEEVKKSGCDYVILRPAFPYKAKFSPKNLEPNPKLDLVRKIKDKLEKGEALKMFSDQKITPTFIDDFVRVIDKVLKQRPKGIYHGVGSTSLSPYELATRVADVFGLDRTLIKKISLKEYLRKNPESRPRQKNMTLSNKKLEKDLGIRMSSLDEGLQKVRAALLSF
jgi:dTDP-4-dehydrorhamnose reductase